MRILLATTLLAATAAASAQTITLSLTPSDYNGYNVSCAHAQDGSIDMTVTGGVPPYHFEWSNGDTIEDVSGLSDGYYHVRMVDVNGDQAQAEITLTRPDRFNLSVTPAEYPNGYSISCNNCYNGSIEVESEGGVAPYTYLWDDAVTTQDRTALGAGNYHVVATDANGCETESEVLYLSQPERDDWGKGGNAGTNPATQYIGTSDNKDAVFKTNGIERFRLLANGEVKISGLSGGLLPGESGLLRIGGDGGLLVTPMDDRPDPSYAFPYWRTNGNFIGNTSGGFLGTTNSEALRIRTNNAQRMIVSAAGHVGIGANLGTLPGLLTLRGDATNWLALQNEQYGSVIGAWHFSNVNGDRLKLEYVPAAGSAYSGLTFWNNGKVSIGNDVDIATDYEYALYVWKGILTDKVKVAVLNEDQWEDRVFKPGYELKSLPEVKTFIAEYGHLPGVPSACEMVDQGLDVLQTDAMLLKKIEELTLHAIRLEERVKELEQSAAKSSKP